VGIVSESPVEDLETYAGRKAVALARIAALQGQVVVAGTRSQQLEWKVIPESVPLVEDESDVAPGLKDVSEFTRVHAKVMLANLFIKLTFKVSLQLLFFGFSIIILLLKNFFFLFVQDWKIKFNKLNDAVAEINGKCRGAKIRPFTHKESGYHDCCSIIVGAVSYGPWIMKMLM